MTDEQDQAEHAQSFGALFRELTAAAVAFTQGQSTLSLGDVAKAYLAAATWIAASISDRADAVRMLREFTDHVERGATIEKLN
jgi:hypothetical protein